MLKDQGNKTIKRECKQIYVKTPEKIGGKTTVEQGLNIVTPEKIYLMCTTKNTRYCFFSLKHYCYYFLALFPFSLSTQYYQISTSLLLWYMATGFILKKKGNWIKNKKRKGQQDYMQMSSPHWNMNVQRLVQPCAHTAAAERERVGHGYGLSFLCRCKEQRCKKVSILHLHTLIYLFLRL